MVNHSGESINGVVFNRRIEDYFPPGGSRPLARYNCTCLLCGKNYDSLYAVVARKKLPGCGCENIKMRKQSRPEQRHDVTNQRFGFCVAVKRLDDGKWLCLCDCGNMFATSLSHLVTGHTKSCGCYRVKTTRKEKMIDLTGRVINKLTVERYLYSKKHPSGASSPMWLCMCECGSRTVVSTGELLSNGTKSCGCLAASKRELEIREWLKEHNIKYTTEQKFDDLCLNGPLRYDFAIFDDNSKLRCLIEHYGVQHYKDNSPVGFGKQQREITDKIKQDYCKSHNIPLYIIKYTENIPERLNKIIAELHVDTVPSSQETA